MSPKPVLISSRSTVTHIPTKLHEFLINSFSVIAWTYTHTRADNRQRRALPLHWCAG